MPSLAISTLFHFAFDTSKRALKKLSINYRDSADAPNDSVVKRISCNFSVGKNHADFSISSFKEKKFETIWKAATRKIFYVLVQETSCRIPINLILFDRPR